MNNILLSVAVYYFREVQKALQTSKNLYTRWCELADAPNLVSVEEYNWTTNELRNSLRSIEWDLEDLEETIDILLLFHQRFSCEFLNPYAAESK